MQSLIDGGRYKINEVLYSSAGYKACTCYDVEVNDGYAMCLVNIYDSKATIAELLPMYFSLRESGLKSFLKLITADGCISALFTYYSGESFEEFCREKTSVTYEERLQLADSLLSCALELDLLESGIKSRVMRSENAVVDYKEMTVHFNFFLYPENDRKESCGSVLGSLLRMLFPPDRYLPEEIESYISYLLKSQTDSCVEVYSGWRSIMPSAAQTRKKYEAETIIQYFLRKIRTRKKK